ncbi:MAG: hypothetical protein JXQ87_05200 [Bacteroidia bacterium]
MYKTLNYLTIVLIVQFFISSCGNPTKTIEVTETWENGSPKTEIEWFNKTDSTYRQLQYFENGNISLEMIFTNSELEKLTGYYETGEIEGVFIYENGETIAGSEYYKNGQKMGEVPRELDGTINGHVAYYYENGNLRSEGEYKNDKRNGLWRDYDVQGNITSEKIYEHGKQVE